MGILAPFQHDTSGSSGFKKMTACLDTGDSTSVPDLAQGISLDLIGIWHNASRTVPDFCLYEGLEKKRGKIYKVVSKVYIKKRFLKTAM